MQTAAGHHSLCCWRLLWLTSSRATDFRSLGGCLLQKGRACNNYWVCGSVFFGTERPEPVKLGHGCGTAPLVMQPGTGCWGDGAEPAGGFLLGLIPGGRCPLHVSCRNPGSGQAGSDSTAPPAAVPWQWLLGMKPRPQGTCIPLGPTRAHPQLTGTRLADPGGLNSGPDTRSLFEASALLKQ